MQRHSQRLGDVDLETRGRQLERFVFVRSVEMPLIMGKDGHDHLQACVTAKVRHVARHVVVPQIGRRRAQHATMQDAELLGREARIRKIRKFGSRSCTP